MMKALIQMSGVPGSGKSTIAAALADDLGALVLDHDIVKSALAGVGLSTDVEDPWSDPESYNRHEGAGRAAYAVAFAIAARTLASDRSVVLDSPCYYADLLDRGRSLATEHHSAYCYVECTADLATIARRLVARDPLPTQCTDLAPQGSGDRNKGLFEYWAANMVRPTRAITVDTTKPGATATTVRAVRRRLIRG